MSMTNLSIDRIVQEVLIDSGSVSNLMGEDDFQKLKNASFKGSIENCSRKLFAYGGRGIGPLQLSHHVTYFS